MSLQLTILTPEGKAYDKAVDLFIAPGAWGEFGVMPRHAPMIASVATGILSVDAEGKRTLLVVGDGILEVNPDGATLLTQLAFEAASPADAEGKLLAIRNPSRRAKA
jgi:F-type H+-transporting ATPase subunit epsilon